MIFIPTSTKQINENIFSVRAKMVNMFIFKEKDDLICIDTGFGLWGIKRGLKKLGINYSDVCSVFLTHSDYDHAGCVNLFKKAKIYLSADEEQMINGSTPRAFGIRYNSKINRPYQLLHDGEIIQVGSIKVQGILTPGHTPGSMSYLINDLYLFSGDTLSLINSKVHTFPFFINKETKVQRESIKRLSKLKNVKMLFTAHSGYTDDFEGAMKQWN